MSPDLDALSASRAAGGRGAPVAEALARREPSVRGARLEVSFLPPGGRKRTPCAGRASKCRSSRQAGENAPACAGRDLEVPFLPPGGRKRTRARRASSVVLPPGGENAPACAGRASKCRSSRQAGENAPPCAGRDLEVPFLPPGGRKRTPCAGRDSKCRSSRQAGENAPPCAPRDLEVSFLPRQTGENAPMSSRSGASQSRCKHRPAEGSSAHSDISRRHADRV